MPPSAYKTNVASTNLLLGNILDALYNSMIAHSVISRVLRQEDLSFLLTNRIPRRLLTHLTGWFSQIKQPPVRDLSIGIWRLFADLHLEEAKKTRFGSMHDCFTRELKDRARPIDAKPTVLVSPCDAIVGPMAASRVPSYTRLRASRTRYGICSAIQSGCMFTATATTSRCASP